METQSTIIFLAEDYIKEMACKTERNKNEAVQDFFQFLKEDLFNKFHSTIHLMEITIQGKI